LGEQTIINCFCKAQFVHSGDESLEEEYEYDDIDNDLAICNEDPQDLNENVDNENDLDEVNEITDKNNVYSNVTSKEALERFYKIKGFMNDNNSEGLTKLFDFEDELYKGIDKTKKQTKITDFFKKN